MSVQAVKASDPAVKNGAWIYCEDHPRGWFQILARWRSTVMGGHDVHVAVKGRGPCDLLDFAPDDRVTIRTGMLPEAVIALQADPCGLSPTGSKSDV